MFGSVVVIGQFLGFILKQQFSAGKESQPDQHSNSSLQLPGSFGKQNGVYISLFLQTSQWEQVDW